MTPVNENQNNFVGQTYFVWCRTFPPWVSFNRRLLGQPWRSLC